MKIAVNTRFLLKNRLEGIGWFTHETLSRIVKQNPNTEFHFLFDRPFDASFIYADNVIPHVLFPQARHPFLWYWWFEFSVTSVLNRIKPDLFLSTDGYCSLRTSVPTNLVIHDLAFEHYPEDLGSLVAKYYRYFTPRFANKARRITTVSQYSAQDIASKYSIDAQNIDVVYNGCNTQYKPLSEEVIQKVRAQYSHGAPYFLFIGALHPRKNIVRLFKAFDTFKKQSGSDHKLLIVGRKGWGTAEIEETFDKMSYRSDVVFTDRLPTDELAKVLASAFALTYVPYFEGFGIPILEAQQAGVPVITSNVSSMPEVANDSGLFVDPFSEQSISLAMMKLHDSPSLTQELIQKGNQNAKKYSWDRTAALLWDSLNRTLSS